MCSINGPSLTSAGNTFPSMLMFGSDALRFSIIYLAFFCGGVNNSVDIDCVSGVLLASEFIVDENMVCFKKNL